MKIIHRMLPQAVRTLMAAASGGRPTLADRGLWRKIFISYSVITLPSAMSDGEGQLWAFTVQPATGMDSRIVRQAAVVDS